MDRKPGRASRLHIARSFSRREVLKMGGAALAGAALLGTAGCGGEGTEEEAGGATRLVFSFGPDPSGNLQEVISRFNEEHRGEIQVEYREMPSDTGQYFNQLRTEFQAGASPIDVIGGDLTWTAQLAANGWIRKLSDRFTQQMRDRFVDAAVNSVTYKGDVWGVPFFTDAGLMYYRKDLLEESGISTPPETWGEFKEVARQVRDESGVPYGFVFQGAEYEGGVVDGLEYVWTHGGDVLNEKQREVVANSPQTIAGLRTERSMIEDDVAPVFVTIFKEPETHATFLAGDVVFARNWPYMYGLIADPAQSNIKTEQVGIGPIPHAQGHESFSGLGGWNFYVNSATSEEKADAAWEFIKFAASPEIARFRAIEGGFLPPLKGLYEDESILEKVPVASFAKEALESARSRPVTPFYSDFSLVMAEKFALSLKGNSPPPVAAKNLAQEMRNIIDLGERLIV